jgi:hypothetical protein
MALSKQDREDFLMRMGAVRKSRSGSDDNPEDSDSPSSSRIWSDTDIEMAIAMGF